MEKGDQGRKDPRRTWLIFSLPLIFFLIFYGIAHFCVIQAILPIGKDSCLLLASTPDGLEMGCSSGTEVRPAITIAEEFPRMHYSFYFDWMLTVPAALLAFVASVPLLVKGVHSIWSARFRHAKGASV